MTVKLHVGYVGVTREGKRVEIVEEDFRDTEYPFYSDDFEWYIANGGYYYADEYNQKDIKDIIGPWVEPVAVKSPIETVTQTKLVEGLYGKVWVYDGGVCSVINTQSELEAAIETLILIRDAKVLK